MKLDFRFDLQRFGGGGGGDTAEVKSSAPGSQSLPTIESATAGSRETTRKKLSNAMSRKATQKTDGSQSDGSVLNQLKKQLLGE